MEQKAWFLDRLRQSKATWKVWGCSLGTLDWRADPQNLPAGLAKKPWPAGYAGFGGGDHSAAYVERAEIYDLASDAGITGRDGGPPQLLAGLAAKAPPPQAFGPVGIAFITPISAPGLPEAFEHRFLLTIRCGPCSSWTARRQKPLASSILLACQACARA